MLKQEGRASSSMVFVDVISELLLFVMGFWDVGSWGFGYWFLGRSWMAVGHWLLAHSGAYQFKNGSWVVKVLSPLMMIQRRNEIAAGW